MKKIYAFFITIISMLFGILVSGLAQLSGECGAAAFEEYRITQNDPNITLYNGTANLETVIAKFVCPDRTWFKIRPGDIFSLLAQSTTPTGISATSVVKLYKTDPNKRKTDLIVLVDYTAVIEFTDRNKLYTIGRTVKMKPKSQLLLAVIADLATSTSYTRFQVSTEMAYDTEDL